MELRAGGNKCSLQYTGPPAHIDLSSSEVEQAGCCLTAGDGAVKRLMGPSSGDQRGQLLLAVKLNIARVQQ